MIERLRERFGRRTLGIVVAILLELLLLAVLLTLGQFGGGQEEKGPAVTTFSASSQPSEDDTPQSAEEPEQAQDSQPEAAQPEQPQPEQVQPDAPAAAPTPVIPTTNSTPAPVTPPAAPAAEAPAPPAPRRPSRPLGPVMGPPAPPSNPGGGMPGDSERVGTAPNGEPMYAARWYRRPDDNELAGYLSTAAGPGWGLIACRTAPDYRVEDCVALDEAPAGVRISRAVVQAAWQFRVRPPRVGGKDMVGEWVRIRIDYGVRQASANQR
ncbi:hypothetical protein GRI97_09585 [Altererythrobacter xixiisoli]|uniref:Protein TonB n=1 Tax=Croceibacterium xixiisoli TaxID=1476466 RepID=A0A6I4TVK1_9SPHN|nr:hypothetical protein [Croceibacterium xixiisoli]